MNKYTILLLIIFTLMVGFGSLLNKTSALFVDISSSTSNTFTASASFPSPSVSPIPSITPAPAATPSGIAHHIVISEVQLKGGSSSNADFVELYNPTNAAISINGWKIRKRDINGTESSLTAISTGIIPAYGYYLWANSQLGYASSIGADISNTNNLAENNSITLLNSSDQIIDSLAWGSGTSQFEEGNAHPTLSNISDNSLERKAYSTSTSSTMTTGIDQFKGNGFDSDSNISDFVLRPVSQPQNSSSVGEIP